jgi:hypothetical protein
MNVFLLSYEFVRPAPRESRITGLMKMQKKKERRFSSFVTFFFFLRLFRNFKNFEILCNAWCNRLSLMIDDS